MSLESTLLRPSFLHQGSYRGYRVSVRLVHHGRQYEPRQFGSPRDIAAFLQPLAHLDREVFYALHLNTRHQLVSCEEVSKGILTAALVHPREVYKAAILTSAQAIVICHNHPSGDPSPSREDMALTERLKNAGEILGIELLDSIIIGHRGYWSASEGG